MPYFAKAFAKEVAGASDCSSLLTASFSTCSLVRSQTLFNSRLCGKWVVSLCERLVGWGPRGPRRQVVGRARPLNNTHLCYILGSKAVDQASDVDRVRDERAESGREHFVGSRKVACLGTLLVDF